MGTSSAFLCLDPLPSHPSMLHSHDLISLAACCRDTRGNRWLLSNIAAVHGTVCAGARRRDSGMVAAVRLPGVWVLTVTIETWWIDGGNFSPSAHTVGQECRLACVTDEMTRTVSLVWNVSAIWIPSSCSVSTCSPVRFCFRHVSGPF